MLLKFVYVTVPPGRYPYLKVFWRYKIICVHQSQIIPLVMFIILDISGSLTNKWQFYYIVILNDFLMVSSVLMQNPFNSFSYLLSQGKNHLVECWVHSVREYTGMATICFFENRIVITKWCSSLMFTLEGGINCFGQHLICSWQWYH